MASRNRVIYQSEALFVSDDVNSLSKADHDELIRVQGANYGFTINRTDVNQFGNLARIDSLVLEPPTVNFDFSYYLGNGKNESALGFSTTPTAQFVSGFLESSSGKNFYIVTSDEGQDATTFNNGENYSLIGIGNAYLSDYTIDLSVGSLPTASVSFEASNINSQNGVIASLGVTGSLPAVNPSNGTVINGTATLDIPQNTGQDGPTALRPGDVVLSFPGFDGGSSESGTLSTLVGAGGFHVQSASLSLPLSRSPISKLGSKFPYARVVDFPVNATMSVNAVLNTVEAGNLANMIAGCGGESDKEVAVTLKSCEGDPVMNWTLKGATLDSESWSSSIGPNKAVDLTFGVQIGGIDDIDQGIIFSGSYSSIPLLTTAYFDAAKTLEALSIQGDIPDSWVENSGISGVTFGSSASYIDVQGFRTNNLVDINIPDNITGIGDDAFSSNFKITDISLGDGVLKVGDGAFQDAGSSNTQGGLVNLDLGNSVEYVGGASFRGVDAEFTLPNSLTGIGNTAFRNNNTVTNITFPPNLVSVGNEAFGTCPNLSSVDLSDVSDGNVFGYSFTYSNGLTELSIPDHWTVVPYSCFSYSKNLSNIDFGTGLTVIASNAFDRCGITGALNLPPNLVTIGNEAFQNSAFGNPMLTTNAYTKINFPANNTLETIGNEAFAEVSTLRSVNIPDSVTSIGDNVFKLDSNLTGVWINCPITSWVGSNAFYLTPAATYYVKDTYYLDYIAGDTWSGAQGLTAGSQILCSGAGCAALQTIIYDGADSQVTGFVGDIPDSYWSVEGSPTNWQRLEIGSSAETIGDSAFDSNFDLSGSLTIPSGVRNIKDDAFHQTAIQNLIIESGVTGIGERAFSQNPFQNPKMTGNVTIPGSVEVLGIRAFSSCTEIESANINARIIGDYAFNNCQLLETVTIGPNVEIIDQSAFYGTSFENGNISTVINNSTNLKSIEGSAFRYQDFTEFNFNEGITGIGPSAFEDCNYLTGIDLPDSLLELGVSAFRKDTFTTPDGALKRISFGTGLKIIPDNCFQEPGLGLTEDVVFPDNINYIGYSAFLATRNPGYSVDFIFGTGITGIGNNAFDRGNNGVVGPPNLVLPPNVKSLGERAFYGWRSHTELVIPPSVESVGSLCFAWNLAITGVTINCPIASWVGTSAFGSNPAATYTITGAYYQDYTGSSWSGDQGIAAGSTFVSGTY